MVNNFQDKANFIWTVADDVLRGTFKAHEYGDVILPFVVLRRLDAVLEGAGLRARYPAGYTRIRATYLWKTFSFRGTALSRIALLRELASWLTH